MSKKYIIEGKIYDYSELSNLCQSKINDEKNPFWVHRAFEFILDWIGSGGFIDVMTSGSTGIPKTLKLKKTIMISSSQMTVRRFELQKYDNILCCLSPDYIAGMMMIVRALENELNLILAEPASDPVLETEDDVEQQLEQDGGEDRNRERVDHDAVHVLDEEVEDDDVDQDVRHPVGEPCLGFRDRDRPSAVVLRHGAITATAATAGNHARKAPHQSEGPDLFLTVARGTAGMGSTLLRWARRDDDLGLARRRLRDVAP